MIKNMKTMERLYLSKQEGQEIYIDIHNLPQHQIDGIRFLYIQFKKKNKGVIVNDPSGYGEVVQVVLFLDAIRSLLSHSMLILCREEKANTWIQHFQKLTKFDDDEILIESFNPNRKKMLICINTMKNIAQFSKRTWSIVIVDDDNENSKEILKLIFKANFKIWITAQDMKENLKTFSQIYKWLIPDDSFVMNNFVPNNKRNVQEVVTKSILLDAFMRDVVLRRNDFMAPPKDETTSNTNTLKSKLTRKNKDATGTKIKRSKKTADESTAEVNEEKPDDNSVATSNNEVTEVAKMDVETFISQEKPIVQEALVELKYINDDENTEDAETSKEESDNSIDSDISSTKIELDSIDPSISGKDNINKYTEINRSSTNVISVDKNKNNEIKMNNEIKSQKDNELTINSDITKNNDTDDVNNLKNHEVIATKSVNSAHKTIDEIIKETEEKTLKKFKGSLLDDIF